jgi:hypothetical protein
VSDIVKVSGTSVVVPPGLAIPETIEGSLPVDSHDVGALAGAEIVTARCRLEYSRDAGRYEIAFFGLDRFDGSAKITGALWRTVRVHAIVRTVIELALPAWVAAFSQARFRRRDGKLALPREYKPSDPDGLLLAALTYRVAEITGENPALAVAELLELKQRTATNWIARARDAGYLTSVDHESEARRLSHELWERMPFSPPRTDEEYTASRAIEIEAVKSWRDHQASRRRRVDGHD